MELGTVPAVIRAWLTKIRRRVWPGGQQQSPSFGDIGVQICVLVGVGALLAVFQIYQLWQSNNAADKQESALREQVSDMARRISDASEANARAESEKRIPHPIPADRDSHVIGSHTSVSWLYAGHDARGTSYEIQLNRLILQDHDPCALPEFLNWAPSGATRFIASDAAHQSTRIPPNEEPPLAPGTYAWRVAAVPVGAQVQTDTKLDDSKRLSEWSEYAMLDIRSSVMDRIRATGHIRVGMNLEQNSRFGRRAGDGRIEGFDVTLVHALLEGCLSRDQGTRKIAYNDALCRNYLSAADPKEHFSQSGSCTDRRDDLPNHLCYDFVPVPTWTGWEDALRRREIDLFIGGATALKSRAVRGIAFTRGYMSFRPLIYVHSGGLHNGRRTLDAWLDQDRVVAAIKGSSNEMLLDEIIAARKANGRRGRMIKPNKEFPTYPALENAMDHNEIDGILIDETFVDHDDWTPLQALNQTEHEGYKSYVRKDAGEDFTVNGYEQIAIAVAGEAAPQGRNSLLWILNDELSRPLIKAKVQEFCKAFWPDESRAGYKCHQMP